MSDIFTPKPFAEITADMVERLRLSTDKLTDFSVGSVVRSLLEANAIELDDYYQEMYLGLLAAIPAAIYLGFGFDLKPASAATGIATVTREDTANAYSLPAGARFVSLAGRYYVSGADVQFDPDEGSKEVLITAEAVGAASNAGPEVISFAEPPQNGLEATNAAVIAGGQDAETEEQRADRFAAFILSLARGTPAALEYSAGLPAIYHPVTGVLAERVQRSSVNETPGHVELYIHNGSYGASTELVSAVQQTVDGYQDGSGWVGGYRPAGMRVDVEVMANLAVDVAMEVSGTVSSSMVQEAVALYLHDAVPGDLVRPIELVNVVLALEGVDSVTILDPTQAFTVQPNHILELGAFALN